MKKTKKMLALALGTMLAMSSLVGCGSASGDQNADDGKSTDHTISVVSREDGSGTRGAFVELTGVEEKDADGNKIDHTTEEAIISNSTEIVMTTVAGNQNAIGYISLGSMNDTVKGVQIDGVEPTAEEIVAGNYTLSRPFNVVTKKDLSDAAKDFMNFMTSEEGQKVISDNGYIEIDNTGAFESNGASGKVVVAGSSSVTPVMEKLKEAYQKINTDVEIEVQESDSTTGINSTVEGTCDIGMASRDLSDEEKAQGLLPSEIALDGIVVIENTQNTVDALTKDQVKDIFCGTITNWDEIK